MSKGTDTRDRRAIDAVPCPKCNAVVGKPCWIQVANNNRPAAHTDRREAYREWRNKHYPNWNAEHGVKTNDL